MINLKKSKKINLSKKEKNVKLSIGDIKQLIFCLDIEIDAQKTFINDETGETKALLQSHVDYLNQLKSKLEKAL